ncbi:MAG TPA: ornithine cyclodeaminase family protein [Solirubrobacterales bacterium]|nr:ornithine cyclodeaminase family protein [Solirubrobacterales bacterium]
MADIVMAVALVLREAEVAPLLDMPAIVEAVEAAMRNLGSGSAQNEPRRRVFAPGGLLNVMFASLPSAGYTGLKAYTVGAGGVRFLVLLFDLDGAYKALIEADMMGAYRTGAATAVGIRALRGAGPHRIAVIGAGHQARTQVLALKAGVDMSELTIFSRTPEKREALAARAREIGLDARAAASTEEAVRRADVVVTITTSGEPVLEADWIEPNALVVGAGSNFPTRAELPPDLIRRSAVVVDQLAAARLESGDLHRAFDAGAFQWESAVELGAILAGSAPAPEGAAVFESHGLALWDVAAGATVLQRAVKAGVGQEIELF